MWIQAELVESIGSEYMECSGFGESSIVPGPILERTDSAIGGAVRVKLQSPDHRADSIGVVGNRQVSCARGIFY